jgi:integrase/recombinase XerC
MTSARRKKAKKPAAAKELAVAKETAADRRKRIAQDVVDARFDATALGAAIQRSLHRFQTDERWSPHTRDLYRRTAQIFRERVMGLELSDLSEISFDLLQAFVDAPNDNGTTPAGGTMCGRATVVNLMVADWYKDGFLERNPLFGRTLRVPRPPGEIRNLIDVEMQKCIRVVPKSIRSTRAPAVLALGRLGAYGSEIVALKAEDIDLRSGKVQLPGCKSAFPRIATLDTWGLDAVGAHLEHPVLSDADPTALDSHVFGRLTSVNDVFTRVLQQAGLWGPEEIRIGSIRLWAGARVLEQTGRIEDAARVLGMRSLDKVAEHLGYQWHLDPASDA